MLTGEDDVEVHALRKRGWSISAIARHTGFDRKTVRAYLSGERTRGVRARPSPDPFEPFLDYVSARLREDRIRGRAPYSTSWRNSGFRCPIRAWPATSASAVCARTVRPAGR